MNREKVFNPIAIGFTFIGKYNFVMNPFWYKGFINIPVAIGIHFINNEQNNNSLNYPLFGIGISFIKMTLYNLS